MKMLKAKNLDDTTQLHTGDIFDDPTSQSLRACGMRRCCVEVLTCTTYHTSLSLRCQRCKEPHHFMHH